jgi:hypothetical protein
VTDPQLYLRGELLEGFQLMLQLLVEYPLPDADDRDAGLVDPLVEVIGWLVRLSLDLLASDDPAA